MRIEAQAASPLVCGVYATEGGRAGDEKRIKEHLITMEVGSVSDREWEGEKMKDRQQRGRQENSSCTIFGCKYHLTHYTSGIHSPTTIR